jgi:hypothetical protein
MIRRLKRALRPLRPLLGPIWHRLRAVVAQDRPHSVPNLLERARLRGERLVRAILRRPDPAIRALRHVELVDLAAGEPYYRSRLGYLGAAASIANELIARRRLSSALELGPYLRPLITGADVMDVRMAPGLDAPGRRIVHDARTVPWPVGDKAYDLFVAFQVFEHLGNSQPEAFREVRRTARNAILSLPIDWEMPDPRNCHHRLSESKVREWFAPIEPTRVVLGNPGHRKRLLFVFEDLPAPDGAPEAPASSPAAAEAASRTD